MGARQTIGLGDVVADRVVFDRARPLSRDEMKRRGIARPYSPLPPRTAFLVSRP